MGRGFLLFEVVLNEFEIVSLVQQLVWGLVKGLDQWVRVKLVPIIEL